MLYNGLALTIDLALRQEPHPALVRHRAALVLGSLREDVWYWPVVRKVHMQPAITHFYHPSKPGGFIPYVTIGPRAKAERLFRKAVREQRAGRTASAMVQLGRASHLLTDMACPVHVHRVIHETDPYEWYIEAHYEQLLQLPVKAVVQPEHEASAAALVGGLASFTERFPPDRTHNWIGAAMRRLGRWQAVDRASVARQVEAIVPVAAGYTAALFRLFLRSSQGAAGASTTNE